jgi:hypothetical protein
MLSNPSVVHALAVKNNYDFVVVVLQGKKYTLTPDSPLYNKMSTTSIFNEFC